VIAMTTITRNGRSSIRGGDYGIRFWLDYVEHAGGLWEDAGDSAMALLPESLAGEYGGLEQLVVTSDPDVAREDGITLLAAGHPFLAQAAQAVLDEGDCGVVRLPRSPATRVPDTEQLLASARDHFSIAHGKIDVTTGAAPGIRYVLRVGALATYALSADDHFQEQVECWVDVESRLVVPQEVVAKLAHLVHHEQAETGGDLPGTGALTDALAYAHEQIELRARDRQAELSAQLGEACARETQRADTYYAEALRSLQRRLDTAPDDRAATLRARMRSTLAERDRRLAEITEKYQAHTTVRPFRLHAIAVPAMRLQADVRRGDRRFPIVLDWLAPARTFAALRCPHCASTAELVAAKSRLGCQQCLAKPEDRPPGSPPALPEPATKQEPKPTAVAGAGAAPTPTRPKRTPARTAGVPAAPVHSAKVIQKAGHKLNGALWDLTARSDRRLRRLLAPGSPASTMHQLFGAAGPTRVLGCAPDDNTLTVYDSPSEPAPSGADMFLIAGQLDCSSGSYAFQLCWRFDGNTPLIEELTPFAHAHWPRMPPSRYRVFHRGGPRLHQTTPAPDVAFDPVARALWERAVPAHGLPLALRCLTAWWRLDGRDQLLAVHSRSVLAAAIDRMVVARAGNQQGARYDEAAATYRVEAGALRDVTPELQRRLRLSASQPW
jgi:hypothetical protein